MENYRLKVSDLETASADNLKRAAMLLVTGTTADTPSAPLFSLKLDLLDELCPILTTPTFVSFRAGIISETDAKLDTKVTKVEGMGLSANNFSNAYKAMLDNPSSFAIVGADNSQFNITEGILSLRDQGVAVSKIKTTTAAQFVSASEKAEWNSKEPALTGAKLAAVESGITAAKVATFESYPTLIAEKQDKLSSAQMNVLNSGITPELIDEFRNYGTQISQKQDALNAAQLLAINSTITIDKVRLYDMYDARIEAAGYHSPAQLAAMNSGIDSTKVASYDSGLTRITQNTTAIQNHTNNSTIHVTAADKTAWSNKEPALSGAKLTAVNSGITAIKVQNYDAHLDDLNIHVTITDKNRWDAKQDPLTSAQLAAVNSGISTSLLIQLSQELASKSPALTFDSEFFVRSGNNISINRTNVATINDIITAVTSIYNYKGMCTYANLPLDDPSNPNQVFDTWIVTDAHGSTPANTAYIWDGSNWKPSSTTIDLTPYLTISDASTTYATKTELTAHTSNSGIHVTATEKSTWNNKQNALSTDQLNAVNSGITAALVSQFNAYSTEKQNALSTAQMNAVNSGITAAKVAEYDGLSSTIAGKQDALTTVTPISNSAVKITTNSLGQVISSAPLYAGDIPLSSSDSTTISEKITYLETLIVDAIGALERIIG